MKTKMRERKCEKNRGVKGVTGERYVVKGHRGKVSAWPLASALALFESGLWNFCIASASQGAGMRGTSSRFLSARASRMRSRSVMFIRTRHRTRRSFVRLIPVRASHISTLRPVANHRKRKREQTHRWRSSRGPRP